MAKRKGRGLLRAERRAVAAAMETAANWQGSADYWREMASQTESPRLAKWAAERLSEIERQARQDVRRAAGYRAELRASRARLHRARHFVRSVAWQCHRAGKPEPVYPVRSERWFLQSVRRAMVLPFDVDRVPRVAYPLQVHGLTSGRADRARYVTLYHVSREFGGHEEGGWWWDCWRPGQSVRVRTRAHAERLAAALSHTYGWDEKRPEIGSVLHTGEVRVVIESRRGATAYTSPGVWE